MSETRIRLGSVALEASFDMPAEAKGLVIFAHGSGSSRLSPRNQMVATELRRGHLLGTFLFDLLTSDEDADYAKRFDIGLLTDRLIGALHWAADELGDDMPLGLFGASTGAAAALSAASLLPLQVRGVVSRGGRPDLAGDALPKVQAPTLLIVGGADPHVIELNRQALASLGTTEKRLEIVPGATHLFEEPGALERVADLSTLWLERYLLQPHPAGVRS